MASTRREGLQEGLQSLLVQDRETNFNGRRSEIFLPICVITINPRDLLIAYQRDQRDMFIIT